MSCTKCNPCSQTQPICVEDTSCECPTFLNDVCVTTTEDLPYTGISAGKTLNEWMLALDEFLSTKFTSLQSFFTLKNVGVGVGTIYKGISILGEKEIKSIKGSSLIDINNLTDEVEVVLNTVALNTYIEANQKTYSSANVGTGAQVYKDSTVVGDNTQFNLRKLKSSDSSVSISEGTDDIDLTVTGAETKVSAGTNVTVTGNGTTATPYVINSTASGGVAQGIEDVITTDPLITNDSVVQLEYGSSFAIQHQTGDTVDQPFFQMDTQVPFISGDYPEVRIGIADQYGDLKVGFDINKYGGGFYAIGGAAGLEYYNTPLTLQSNSLVHKAYVDQNVQRIITGNANVENEDNNSTIIINNGASNITITVDTDSMGNTVCVGFIQQGTGTVTFVASGVTINTPTGLKIKGQNYNAYLEQIGTSNVFHLLGNVIA